MRLGLDAGISRVVRRLHRGELKLKWKDWNRKRLPITLQGGHTVDFFGSEAEAAAYAQGTEDPEVSEVYSLEETVEAGKPGLFFSLAKEKRSSDSQCSSEGDCGPSCDTLCISQERPLL